MSLLKQLYYQIIDAYGPRWLILNTKAAERLRLQEARIRYLEDELEERGAQVDHAIAQWQWHRDRGNRMHRRAQKAEGELYREVVHPLYEVAAEHQLNASRAINNFHLAELHLQRTYQYLPPPLQEEFRTYYPRIADPIRTETFSKGS